MALIAAYEFLKMKPPIINIHPNCEYISWEPIIY